MKTKEQSKGHLWAYGYFQEILIKNYKTCKSKRHFVITYYSIHLWIINHNHRDRIVGESASLCFPAQSNFDSFKKLARKRIDDLSLLNITLISCHRNFLKVKLVNYMYLVVLQHKPFLLNSNVYNLGTFVNNEKKIIAYANLSLMQRKIIIIAWFQSSIITNYFL